MCQIFRTAGEGWQGVELGVAWRISGLAPRAPPASSTRVLRRSTEWATPTRGGPAEPIPGTTPHPSRPTSNSIRVRLSRIASRPWLRAARADLRGTYNLAMMTHMAKRRALHDQIAHILRCIHTMARNWLRPWHHMNDRLRRFLWEGTQGGGSRQHSGGTGLCQGLAGPLPFPSVPGWVPTMFAMSCGEQNRYRCTKQSTLHEGQRAQGRVFFKLVARWVVPVSLG